MYQSNDNSILTKACVFGCSGYELTNEEEDFFRSSNPLGFIIFSRNIKSPNQLIELITSLRSCVKHKSFIFIDQEGGSVQRLSQPHWRKCPPFGVFGKIYEKDNISGIRSLELNLHLIALELMELGIDVNCSPCLDIPRDRSSKIIDDRAFSQNKDTVVSLARYSCLNFMDSGIVPVIKHIPGHGACLVDSHKELPVVNISMSKLREIDFMPFKSVSDLPVLAMTAHAVYPVVDEENAATISKDVIKKIIRGYINFKGLIISDDICMDALKGSYSDRAISSIKAGCDIVLHCSGDMHQMEEIASVIPTLSQEALKSIKQLDNYRGKAKVEIDKESLASELSNILDNFGFYKFI